MDDQDLGAVGGEPAPAAPSFAPILATAAQANPAHIGLIMDGNGRWARARGLSRTHGHQAGLESFRKILRASTDFGVPILTAYGFSSENWSRPREEVSALMTLLVSYLQDYRHEFLEQDCRFIVSGRRQNLDPSIQDLIQMAESETQHCTSHLLNLALSYGGHQEITDAVRQIAVQVATGQLNPHEIEPEIIAGHLYTRSLPPPDLIIRTSGEQRLSGFLLWQSAYAELLFHQALWPDFTPPMFLSCIEAYRGRERRFGLVKNTDQPA